MKNFTLEPPKLKRQNKNTFLLLYQFIHLFKFYNSFEK
jgi:hypothetical protein